jgi:hypothetical protein
MMIMNNSLMSLRCALDARHLAPCRESSIAEQPVVQGAHQMPPQAKEVVNRTVHREKPLGVTRGFEPTHLAFLLAGRLMRHFCFIVCPFVLVVADTRQKFPACCPVAA